MTLPRRCHSRVLHALLKRLHIGRFEMIGVDLGLCVNTRLARRNEPKCQKERPTSYNSQRNAIKGVHVLEFPASCFRRARATHSANRKGREDSGRGAGWRNSRASWRGRFSKVALALRCLCGYGATWVNACGLLKRYSLSPHANSLSRVVCKGAESETEW